MRVKHGLSALLSALPSALPPGPAPAPGRRRVLAAIGGLLCTALLVAPAHAGSFEDWFLAARKDDVAVIRSLLQRGFDVNATEPQRGDTALILALREDAMKVFRFLLTARDIDLEKKAANGDTALMIAAFRRNKPAVEALLTREAEVNRPGWTALHYAAAAGSNEIVSLLLEHHAYIDAESPNKSTPIMMAAWAGHILTVKLLLDEGADANLRNAVGMDAIDFARHGNHPDIVDGLRYRLQRGPGS